MRCVPAEQDDEFIVRKDSESGNPTCGPMELIEHHQGANRPPGKKMPYEWALCE